MIGLIVSFAFLIAAHYFVMFFGASESKPLRAMSIIVFLCACFMMLYFGITNA